MEVTKVCPEELQHKFRSKSDLYELLSIDLHYLLPSIDKCPMYFLRQALCGAKKIVKREDITELIVPRYQELSVDKVWPLVREVEDLAQYFPDYKENQLPDRRFMFAILATFRFDQLDNMIKNANKNRSLDSKDKDNELVYITQNLYKEIKDVKTHKLSKGKATYLLKRSAKLGTKRKSPKVYQLNFDNFNKPEEERKEIDKMD